MRISFLKRREASEFESRALVWNRIRQTNDSSDGLAGDAAADAPLPETSASDPVEEPTPTALPPAAATEAPLPDTVTPSTDLIPSSTEILPTAVETPPPAETTPPVQTTPLDTLPPAAETSAPLETLIEALPSSTEAALPTETAAPTIISETATPSISVPEVVTPPPTIIDQATSSAEPITTPEPSAALSSSVPLETPSAPVVAAEPSSAAPPPETSSDIPPTETSSVELPASTSATVSDSNPAPPAIAATSSVVDQASSALPSSSDAFTVPSAISASSGSSLLVTPAASIASTTGSASITGETSKASSDALANVLSSSGTDLASSIAELATGSSTFLTVTSTNAKSTSASASFQRLSAVASSFTQAADSLPTSGVANLGDGSGTNAGTLSGGPDVDGNTGVNGITQSTPGKIQASKTTVIISAVAIGLGSIALFIGIVFLIRRIMRKRRIGKAESPPSSPLLTPIDSPMPLSIARSMSQRSGGNDFWGFSNGNTIAGPRGNEKQLDFGNDGYRGVAPLSPLPPAAKGPEGGNKNDFAGFKLFPGPTKGDDLGKVQTPKDF